MNMNGSSGNEIEVPLNQIPCTSNSVYLANKADSISDSDTFGNCNALMFYNILQWT